MPFFEALVGRFYAGVADDPILRPIYPEADLAPAQRRLTLFLAQYWGGPRTYDEERGHPRLRMRHAPFAIDAVARDRWLLHMRAAIAELAPPAGRGRRTSSATSRWPPRRCATATDATRRPTPGLDRRRVPPVH